MTHLVCPGIGGVEAPAHSDASPAGSKARFEISGTIKDRCALLKFLECKKDHLKKTIPKILKALSTFVNGKGQSGFRKNRGQPSRKCQQFDVFRAVQDENTDRIWSLSGICASLWQISCRSVLISSSA
jgi:hypothetical protein